MEHGQELLKKRKYRKVKPGITVEAFGYTCIEGPEWNYEALSVVEIHGGISFPLSDDENEYIKLALEEIKPVKDERWHKIRLNRIMEIGRHGEPNEDYYQFESITLIPIQCEKCGTNIKEKEAQAMIDAGVNQYCSEYCANVAGGVPIPGSNGDWVFERHNIQYG